MRNLLISLALLLNSSILFAEEVDPFEEANRVVYDFNETIARDWLTNMYIECKHT